MSAEISVVIPTFRRPRETCRAIRSALAQSKVSTEIIVVDDAPDTPFVADSDVAPQIRVVRQAVNGGPASARNAGVLAATAPWIAFLDSDDFWLPDTLGSRFADATAAGEAALTLWSAPVYRWQPGQSLRWMAPRTGDDLVTLASSCWYGPGTTALFSRQTWDRVGLLDPALRRLEDLDWSIRLARLGGRLAVSTTTAGVIQTSRAAALGTVEAAALRLAARYGPGGEMALPAAAWRGLRGYLALERAASASGDGLRWRIATELAASFMAVPRLRLHLIERWSAERDAEAERAEIEAMNQRISGATP